MAKAIVFGGSGFLGSHIADALTEKGISVTVFDIVPSPYLRKGQRMIVGDILDGGAVAAAVAGCDYVYHFAGLADIDGSTVTPADTMRVNVMGTANIAEACRHGGVKRLIFASTIYVYSAQGSFYRVSKQACEKLIEEYGEQFALSYTILRYGSLYGPRANGFNAISTMLRQAITEKKITRSGGGDEIREYIHVKDAAALSVRVLDESFAGEHVIITGTRAMKIKEMLTMIREMFNNDIKIEYRPSTNPHHYTITPYCYKPKVAKRITPEPYHDLGQGLLELIHELEDARSVNPRHQKNTAESTIHEALYTEGAVGFLNRVGT